ncbi:MAG: hypothetical protein CK425_00505 [Parachlamydia sp.]|nr:MAG: hypothetical protein CK425_00505 [Parachlamydia sp.]
MDALGQLGVPAVYTQTSSRCNGRFLSKTRFPYLKKYLYALFEQALGLSEGLFIIKLFDIFDQNYKYIEIQEACSYFEIVFELYEHHPRPDLRLGILKSIHRLALFLNPHQWKLFLSQTSVLLKVELGEHKIEWNDAILDVLIEQEDFCENYIEFAKGKNALIDFSIAARLWGDLQRKDFVISCARTMLERLHNRIFTCKEVHCLLAQIEKVGLEDICLICQSLFKHKLTLFSAYYWLEGLFETLDRISLECLLDCFFRRAFQENVSISNVLILVKMLLRYPLSERGNIKFEEYQDALNFFLLNLQDLKQENKTSLDFLCRHETRRFNTYIDFSKRLQSHLSIFELILQRSPNEKVILNKKIFSAVLTYLGYFKDILSLKETKRALCYILKRLSLHSRVEYDRKEIIASIIDISKCKTAEIKQVKQFCRKMSKLFSISDDWSAIIIEFCKEHLDDLETVNLCMKLLPYLLGVKDKASVRKNLVLNLENMISDPVILIILFHRACHPESTSPPEIGEIIEYAKSFMNNGLSLAKTKSFVEMLLDRVAFLQRWRYKDIHLFFTIFSQKPIVGCVLENGWSSRILHVLMKPFILSDLKKTFDSFITKEFTPFYKTHPLSVAEQFFNKFITDLKKNLQMYELEGTQRLHLKMTLNLIKACVKALQLLQKRYHQTLCHVKERALFFKSRGLNDLLQTQSQLDLCKYRRNQRYLLEVLAISYRRIKSPKQSLDFIVKAQVEISKLRKVRFGYDKEPIITISSTGDIVIT